MVRTWPGTSVERQNPVCGASGSKEALQVVLWLSSEERGSVADLGDIPEAFRGLRKKGKSLSVCTLNTSQCLSSGLSRLLHQPLL